MVKLMNSFIRLVYKLTYALLIIACVGGSGSEVRTVTTPLTAPAPDTLPPVIILNGSPTITLEFGCIFNDPGATATDDVSSKMEVTASNPNHEDLGTQQIVYKAVDAAGNSSSVTRQLIVQDTAPPDINLVGDASVTIELGAVFFDAGALANDNYVGTLEVSADFSGVDFETLGAPLYCA